MVPNEILGPNDDFIGNHRWGITLPGRPREGRFYPLLILTITQNSDCKIHHDCCIDIMDAWLKTNLIAGQPPMLHTFCICFIVQTNGSSRCQSVKSTHKSFVRWNNIAKMYQDKSKPDLHSYIPDSLSLDFLGSEPKNTTC